MHFRITLTSNHVAEYGLVPFSKLGRLADEKYKEESRQNISPPTYYVGRPNNNLTMRSKQDEQITSATSARIAVARENPRRSTTKASDKLTTAC